MPIERPIYMVDTNVVLDYVDIIPGSSRKQPEESTVDLSHAHTAFTSVTVRELDSFKREKSERGESAREANRRFRWLAEQINAKMEDFYEGKASITIEGSNQTVSILPVHKDFKRCLPFRPSEDDMDGQIILGALTVAFLQNGLPIDGSATLEEVRNLDTSGVILLTNDNGLAIRARERGIQTMRYGYKYPEPYTGRREVTVPKNVFDALYYEHRVESWLWEGEMTSEPPLVANEFIVMHLEPGFEYPFDYDEQSRYFPYVGRYDVREDAIVSLKHTQDFPVLPLQNVGQAIYAEALMNPEIAAIVCTGPAGSGKTYMATIYGYHACKNGEFIGVTVVPCDSRSKLGALPGDLDEKMDPDVQPLKNALRNYLMNEDSKFRKELGCLQKYGASDKKKTRSHDYEDNGVPEKSSIKVRLEERVDLIWKNWFANIHIDYARGRDTANEVAIFDEFQDQSVSQADTLIKRIGANGKIIITGDIDQIHAPYIDSSSSGLAYASKILMDSPMVAQICFTEDEVIRHPLVRMIAQRQKAENGNHETE